LASVRKWHSGWQVRWYDPNGRQRTKTFKRKTDAKLFANHIEVDKQRGTYVDPQLGKLLFADWAQEWLQTKINLRASTWTRDESYLRNHVMPEFGGVALARISKLQVQAWIRELVAKGLHPSTIRECYRILRSILNEAADARLIVESPCRSVTLPRVPQVEQRFLTASQVEQLATATAPQFRVLIYSAVYLGCRWGELVGLKRENLSLLKREVRIVGTLEEIAGGIRYVEETKTSASRRTIAIPGFLVDLLAAHLKDQARSEFVFTTKNGRPIRRSNFRQRVWRPAVNKAGLDIRLRFHDLRHTCAALLIEQGAHPKEIQARLGHSSITTTLDRYGHLMPSLGHQLAVNLDEVRTRAVADVDQTWTDGDGEVIEFPYEIEENEDLPADSEGGRCWVRTSDPCVVSAVLYR
jgi:integrase